MKPFKLVPTPTRATPRRSYYQSLIFELLRGRPYDPRQIEALMRDQYGTLDHLSRAQFRQEIKICIKVIDEMGPEMAEACAKSHGL